MEKLSIRLWTTKHLSNKEIEDYILRNYQGYKIIKINESLFPDKLEDEILIYCYYVKVERKE